MSENENRCDLVSRGVFKAWTGTTGKKIAFWSLFIIKFPLWQVASKNGSLRSAMFEFNLSEGLSHLSEEMLGQLNGLVHSEVEAAIANVLLDPARKLPTLVRSGVTLP